MRGNVTNARQLQQKVLKERRADLWQIRAFALAEQLQAMGQGDLAQELLRADKQTVLNHLNKGRG